MEQREAEDRAKLKALREAAKIGPDDIAAVRYRDVDSEASLRAHLEALTERALSRQSK